VNVNAVAQLPSFDYVGLEAGADFGGWDVRELKGSGVPLENTSSAFALLLLESNENRTVSGGGFLAAASHAQAGPVASAWGWTANLYGTVRPHPALETRLELFLDRTPTGPRFIEDLGDGHFLLSPLLSDSISLTLRQQWVVTPRLTLQAYAQLFTAYGAYGTYYEGVSDALGVPAGLDAVRGLHARPAALPGGRRSPSPTHPALPQGLMAGAASDALMVKWSWYI
jgi:hypothetical protein